MVGFAFGDRQPVMFPVDVVQGQGGDLAGAQSVGDQQQQIAWSRQPAGVRRSTPARIWFTSAQEIDRGMVDMR